MVFRSLVLILVVFSAGRPAIAADTAIRVMSFNIWVGGEAGDQPLEQTAEVIRVARADVVGIQESHGHEVDGVRTDNGPVIAEQLGWHYQSLPEHNGVLSRFPIRAVTSNRQGVVVEYAPGRMLYFFNVHFAASPYQPYQLLEIPYGDYPFISTADEAVEWAHRARGEQVARTLKDLQTPLREGHAIVLTGDFNEPSYLDWTDRSRRAGHCPVAVRYPATLRFTQAGLKDTYRAVHGNEVRRPGWTWTPVTSPDDSQDHHDRIDFVFASRALRIVDSEVVGEAASSADIVVTPWPSDHRAVVTSLLITGQ